MKTATLHQKLKEMPLIPESFKYKRAIGVEIECFSNNYIDESEMPFWVRATEDNSIYTHEDEQFEREFKLLTPRNRLQNRIKSFCSILNKYNYNVNETCGLHVHFDMRDKTFSQVKRVAIRLNTWLRTLKYLTYNTRHDSEWCQFGISTESRYRAVNIMAFKQHRTLEIRLLEGTVDPIKIISWIRLVEAIIKIQRFPRSSECLKALNELPLKKEDKKYWTKRYKMLN